MAASAPVLLYTERTPIGVLLWTMQLAALPSGGTQVSWRIRLAGGRKQRVLYALVGARVRRQLHANIESFARCVDSAA